MACRRAKANRGSAGVDALTIEATSGYRKTHCLRTREDLQTGRHWPRPVRRLQINPRNLAQLHGLGGCLNHAHFSCIIVP